MEIHIKFEIIIDAPITRVWAILTDFQRYAEWSPTVKRFSEVPKEDKYVYVRLEQPGGTGITMRPKILVLREPNELRWKGSLFIKGLFDGEHYFCLEAIGKDKTRFVQGEYFSGILILFMRNMIHGNTSRGFQLFNAALKERAEGL